MRYFLSLIVTGSIIFLLSSCSENSSKWQKYTASDGSFAINMPENYTKIDKRENTVFGRQTVHYITWKPSSFALDKFRLFQLTYTDCPKGSAADTLTIGAMLDKSMTQRKTDFPEVDVDFQNVSIDGYPGREFIYNPPSDNVITIVKECIANNRLYEMTVIAKKNYPTNVEIGNFFTSFQVLR
jgi:hypothetical protein